MQWRPRRRGLLAICQPPGVADRLATARRRRAWCPRGRRNMAAHRPQQHSSGKKSRATTTGTLSPPRAGGRGGFALLAKWRHNGLDSEQRDVRQQVDRQQQQLPLQQQGPLTALSKQRGRCGCGESWWLCEAITRQIAILVAVNPRRILTHSCLLCPCLSWEAYIVGPLSYRDSHLLWDPCLNVTVNNCGTPVIMRQSTIVGPLSYRDSRLLWDPCLNATVNYCGSPVPCPKTTVSVKMIQWAQVWETNLGPKLFCPWITWWTLPCFVLITVVIPTQTSRTT